MRCICCNGPMRLIGTLGDTDHYRCRNCGWDYHEPHDEDTDDDRGDFDPAQSPGRDR